MTPAQMEAEIATLIRQQQENRKKRRLRWGLGLGVASLILSVVSIGLMMGTGEEHPPPKIISFMPLLVILPLIAALVQERKGRLSQ